MTMNNEHIALALYKDRAQELQREAANDRLARQAIRKLRPRRRASRGQQPAPSIPRQRNSSSQTTAKVA